VECRCWVIVHIVEVGVDFVRMKGGEGCGGRSLGETLWTCFGCR